jgi:hypothetical protein
MDFDCRGLAASCVEALQNFLQWQSSLGVATVRNEETLEGLQHTKQRNPKPRKEENTK